MQQISRENRFSQGIRDGLPICLGYLSVSFAFGIFAVKAGLTVWKSVIISMTNVTSAGQLAGVPIIANSLPFIEMALSQLIINLRYALMSISLSQKLDRNVTIFDRFVISFMNTDEIFAVASGRADSVGRNYLYGLALTPYLGWSAGTALGAAAGSILPTFITNALGIAIYGMFIAIIIPAAKKSHSVLAVVLVSCTLSVIFAYTPVLKDISSGFAIIICSVFSSALFAILCPTENKNEQKAAND